MTEPRALPAQDLSDFTLGNKIGDGGSAEVFRAHNRTFDVDVALKRWYRPLTEDERRKFYDECRLHWQLSDHPNIVRLYWAEARPGERPWLATELQEMSLADRLARGPLSSPEAWRLAHDILTGLAAVHGRKHLHRDIKPANVLLKGGRGVLCDLGIAMRIGARTKFNAAGTANFIAPELLAGRPPTARSDVYSAAVTIDLLFPHPQRPPSLQGLLDRATSRDPERRPVDAEAFRLALDGIAPAGRARPGHGSTGKRVAVIVGAVGALAVGGAAVAYALPDTSPDSRPGAATGVSPSPTTAGPAVSAATSVPVVLTAATPSRTPSREPATTPAAAAGPPATVRCGTQVSAGHAIAYTKKLISSPSGAATMTASGTTTTVRFDGQYTWAGLLLGLPKGICRYRVDLEAQIVEPTRTMSDNEGWGYGLGPCNVVTNGQPFGFSLQNAMIKLGGQVSGNSGTFRNPDVNDGKTVDIPADYGFHRWSLDVDGKNVRITREFGVAVTTAAVTGSSGLPETCDGTGVFLRVFNGAAAFRGISVTGY